MSVYNQTPQKAPTPPKPAVLMDWQAAPDGPPVYDGKPYSQLAHLAEAMPRFADMVTWLRAHGLAAPQLYALDRAAGFALLEDFGDRTLAAEARFDKPLDQTVFYFEAVETLLHLHAQDAPDFLPAYDGAVQAIETSLFTDWYLPYCGVTPDATAKAEWRAIWQKLGDDLAATNQVAVLRDYHSGQFDLARPSPSAPSHRFDRCARRAQGPCRLRPRLAYL
jgi:aminoglycoside/choline kinase family phosphotransferase